MPDFTPIGNDPTSHMLEVIVVEKDTLQVIDDYIDCPIGGVPEPFVIVTSGESEYESARRYVQSYEPKFLEK